MRQTGGRSFGRNLHEVQVRIAGLCQGLIDGQNAQLLTSRSDHPDGRNADLFVDPSRYPLSDDRFPFVLA